MGSLSQLQALGLGHLLSIPALKSKYNQLKDKQRLDFCAQQNTYQRRQKESWSAVVNAQITIINPPSMIQWFMCSIYQSSPAGPEEKKCRLFLTLRQFYSESSSVSWLFLECHTHVSALHKTPKTSGLCGMGRMGHYHARTTLPLKGKNENMWGRPTSVGGNCNPVLSTSSRNCTSTWHLLGLSKQQYQFF